MDCTAAKIHIAGCGYTGTRIALYFRERAADITCMTRLPEHADMLAGQGFSAVSCSLDNCPPAVPVDLSGRLLFYLVPPPGGGDVDSRARSFCAALSCSAPPAKIVYASALSVYGGTDGSVLTEASPVAPQTARGRRRRDAETCFTEYGKAAGIPTVILRIGGIYGPGRLPVAQIRQQLPLLREQESGLCNLIHADDLATVCCRAAIEADSDEIFNVCDGHPCTMTEYFNTVADMLGETRPPQVSRREAEVVMSPLMLSYSRETYRADNARMLERLNVTLRYPSIREGVAASLTDMDWR